MAEPSMSRATDVREESVLESKDKDQLLAIAKALGLNASVRAKKSDIIDQILDTTAGSSRRAGSTELQALTDAVMLLLIEVDQEHPSLLHERLSEIPPDQLARDAVNAMVAPALWARTIGPTCDTTQLVEKLGISRQAIAQRVEHRSLLALPGRRSRVYPTWQIDWARGIRPIVPVILRRWFQAEPEVEPETIAMWACTEFPTVDGPRRPGELIESGGNDELLLAHLDDTIARRTQ